MIDLLEATSGSIAGGSQVAEAVSSYHTDSREVEPGGLFFALRGAERDGHDFAREAARRGAAALVVERPAPTAAGVAQIVVADSWKALYSLATFVLGKVNPLVVGVTGSNGKTSTKEMTAAVLATRLRVLKSEGNLNTETGVPLTILGLEPGDQALVLELAMQRAGEITRLTDLARPKVGIVTNVGTVHMEFFASRDQLARAKGELVASLPADGLAVLDAEGEYFELLTALSAAPVRSFGVAEGDLVCENYRQLPDGGCSFRARGVEIRLRLTGRHQARNALAALLAGEFAGIAIEEAAPALAGVGVDRRLQQVPAPEGYTIVDDSYNASPESMLAAFETLAELPRRGRLLAVLGEMRELGALAEQAHRQVGERAAGVFDEICVLDVGFGRVLAEAAGATLVASKPDAAGWVRERATPGSIVLVKASHGVALDELVRELSGR